MDWDRIEQNWDQVKYRVRDQWGKFTFDDLWEISGRREQLEKKLKERYGYQEDFAKKQGLTAVTTAGLLPKEQSPADAPGLTAKVVSRSQGCRSPSHFRFEKYLL